MDAVPVSPRPHNAMVELTRQQVAILERLRGRGFIFVAFPMYANYIGARKGNCAALLAPLASGGLKIFGDPCYLVAGNLSARVTRGEREWFVWKKERVEATPARLEELLSFATELAESLLPST